MSKTPNQIKAAAEAKAIRAAAKAQKLTATADAYAKVKGARTASKAARYAGKAKLAKARTWKPAVNALAAAHVAAKANEEETKRQIAANQANVQKAAISKWNNAINNTAEPAEGTGDPIGGNIGITVIGDE